MSNYFNADGEPLMTAAQARFEASLDAEYDVDAWYDRPDYDEDFYYDNPHLCSHGDASYSNHHTIKCDLCDTEGIVVVSRDWDETDDSIEDVIVWASPPFNGDAQDEYHVPEDAGLDTYMEDRISTMYC